MRLFFILGREPALSAAEILAVLERHNHPLLISPSKEGEKNSDHPLHLPTQGGGESLNISREVLVLDVSAELDPHSLMRELGGTIKIGRVVHEFDQVPDSETLAAMITPSFPLTLRGMSAPSFPLTLRGMSAPSSSPSKEGEKIMFGFSAYDTSEHGLPEKQLKNFQKMLHRLGIDVKRSLEANGHRARFVTSREPTLSSVVIETNKLIEIVFLLEKTKLTLGKTAVVQPWKEMSARDYGRPERDTLGGMMPPKLARMLVNLACAREAATLLDPFCGSGTLLMEAWLLGYRSLIGSDIDSTAIARTKSNLLWLDPNAAKMTRLIDSGIKHLPNILESSSVDAVVTEPYLGPPLRGRETHEDIEEIDKQLQSLFRDMLTAFRAILKPRGRAIVALPLWKLKKDVIHSSIIPHISEHGFVLKSPLPTELITPALAPEFGSGGKTLIYGRPDQRVWREIAILEKVG